MYTYCNVLSDESELLQGSYSCQQISGYNSKLNMARDRFNLGALTVTTNIYAYVLILAFRINDFVFSTFIMIICVIRRRRYSRLTIIFITHHV